MKTNKISRWGILTIVGVLVLLIVGGAIFAQGQSPRRGGQQGPGGGPGMARHQGPGQGPGMRGQDPGRGHGPEAIFGMQFLMQDPEIMSLMAQIKIIDGFNKLELTKDQVEVLRGCAIDAQAIVNSEFGGVRDEIRGNLEDQLDNVLSGNEIEPEFMRGIMESAREQHNPEDIKEQLEGILERATDVFTEDQLRKAAENAAPQREIRERVENWRNSEGQGQEWFRNLGDEEGAEVEQRFRGQIEERIKGAAKMKLMMMLLSPQVVDAMDLWLDAN